MKLEHSLTLYTKINSKWFKHLNTRHETIKLVEAKTGKTFSDINYASVSLGQSPKATEMKTKIKMGPKQIQQLFHSKRHHKKMKRQATKWEEILVNYATKHLISKIYKQFTQLSIKK